ncbi:hypothetical protein [Streptomyces sp. NPDC060333]|uniref:hypothetical protein n=1 Tax=Streptomyces sp. NPDC060333 TaxID=3347098 RepID=UPI00364DF970
MTSAVFMTFPPSRWEWTLRADGAKEPPAHWDDFLGYLLVYIGGITVRPWLLGYCVTRLPCFARARRARPGEGAEEGAEGGAAQTPATPAEGPSGGAGAA